ncbi:MAG: ATP-binding protein [Bacteroidota bacterium]
MRVPLFLVLLFSLLFSFTAYPISQRIEKLDDAASSYCYAGHFDSAQALVIQFLKKPGLDHYETFYAHFIYANVIKSSGQPLTALEKFRDCFSLMRGLPDPAFYESLVNGKVAECYFDMMDYKKASVYASHSIELSPDTSLRKGGHAINYILIGYELYENKKYSEAIDKYKKAAEQYTRYGLTCELPLCYMKMAKVYNSMRDMANVKNYLSLSAKISDSCRIEQYSLLTKRTEFDIYLKNNDHKNALQALMEVNEMVSRMESESKKMQMNELEIKYQTLLANEENKNLRELNNKNQELVKGQKNLLYISVAAIIFLVALIIALIILSRQRKKVHEQLVNMNEQLELKVSERTIHLSIANEKIKTDADLLARQNNQLTDFCNIVSHNLRSPLANMSMLTQYIEKSDNEEERKLLIEKLKPVLSNLNETFNELVESLQVRQDTNIPSSDEDVAGCVRKITENLEGEILDSEAEIITDFSKAPVIHYPAKYLNSILHNLLSNAIKYCFPGRKPVIEIITRKKGKNILLTVKDNGLGIDLKRYKDKIFKIRKVFHEHPEAKGFGLYITKTQLDTMGDTITVESEPEKGSTFIVEFKNQYT